MSSLKESIITLSQSAQLKLDFRLINVIGIDGSGKTTLCEALLREFGDRYSHMKYVHTYHKSILLKPVNLIVKTFFMRGTDQFADYSKYRERKTSAIKRHTLLSRIYAFVWILDYFLQTSYKVGIPMLFGKGLIIDRYVYDAMINVSVANKFSPKTTYTLVELLFKFLPKPSLVILIDLPEDVAFGRKNDIQSIEYLRERRYRYLSMAEKYEFMILDGTSSPKKLVKDCLTILKLRTTNNANHIE